MRLHIHGVLGRLFVAMWFAALTMHISAGHARAADALPGRWDGRDIGNVGVAGTASNSGGGTAGAWMIAGSGDDIWGTADAFHYVSLDLTTSPSERTSFIARLGSEDGTDPFAKAGLMLRESYDPAAAHVILDAKPGGGIEFMRRGSDGADTVFLAGATMSFPVWLRLDYQAPTATAYVSSDGSAWTSLGSVDLTGALRVGFAVTSHDASTLNRAVFDQVSLTVIFGSGGRTLPPEWSQADVDTTGLAGSASYSDGTFTVSGAGSDIWGTADSFHFAYPICCVSQRAILARVTGVQDTDTFAKAGVMIRETLEPTARYVILDVRPNGDIEFMARFNAGESTAFIAGGHVGTPGWLKLEDAGGFVSGYASSDGSQWSKIGDLPISFSTKFLGLAVTSHDTTTLNTSTFDNVLFDWSTRDIGNTGVTGSAAIANSRFTIRGAGSDIWGTEDSFHYVYKPLAAAAGGLHQILTQVFTLPTGDAFAKGGLMIRNSLDPTSAQVILDVKPGGGVEFMVRSADGGQTRFVGGGTYPVNGVLKLTIDGQSFSGFACESDVTSCQTIGTATASISSNGFFGMAVTSHDPGALTSVVFREPIFR